MPQSRRRRGSAQRKQVRIRDAARTLAGSVFGAAANRISPDVQASNISAGQPPVHKGRGRRRQGNRQHQQGQSRPWVIRASQRPWLASGLDQGDLAQVFGSLHDIWVDCPGAAIATCHYILSHQQPHTNPQTDYAQTRARNSLTRFQRQVRPDKESLASAQAGIRETRSSSDPRDRFSASTTFLEEMYLRRIKGLTAEISDQELAQQLVANAENFRASGSQARQAHNRLMAADVFLQTGDITQADAQVALAFQLLGQAYPDKGLTELGLSMEQPSMRQPVGASAQVPSGGSFDPNAAPHEPLISGSRASDTSKS